MEIVIDIPEEIYNNFMNDWVYSLDILHAVRHGTILPEHHGRLIDEQQIIDRFKPIEKYEFWRVGTDGLFNVLSDAPTIIEGSERE